MDNKDQYFNDLKAQHPDWSDEQIWTTVSVMISGDSAITAEGPNPTLTEDLLRSILEKAKEWLLEKLPEIFLKVAEFFNDLIDTLPDWAKKGLSYAFKLILNYFGNSYE